MLNAGEPRQCFKPGLRERKNSDGVTGVGADRATWPSASEATRAQCEAIRYYRPICSSGVGRSTVCIAVSGCSGLRTGGSSISAKPAVIRVECHPAIREGLPAIMLPYVQHARAHGGSGQADEREPGMLSLCPPQRLSHATITGVQQSAIQRTTPCHRTCHTCMDWQPAARVAPSWLGFQLGPAMHLA